MEKSQIILSLEAEDIEDCIALQVDLAFDLDILEIESFVRKGLFSLLVWIKKEKGIRVIAGVHPDAFPVFGSGRVADISF